MALALSASSRRFLAASTEARNAATRSTTSCVVSAPSGPPSACARVRPMGSASIDALRAVPLFAGLDDGALGDVAASTTVFEAPAGTVLVQVGQPGAGLFVIEEGEVEVDLPGRIVTLGPGAFFGEVSLLTDGPRTGRVRARTDVRCLALARGDFARLLADEPAIAVRMLPVLAARLAEAP